MKEDCKKTIKQRFIIFLVSCVLPFANKNIYDIETGEIVWDDHFWGNYIFLFTLSMIMGLMILCVKKDRSL